MTSDSYDVIIVGGGPGGYVCAIRAAQLGLKVACVEKRNTLGGTCLNIGCIPSKALLQSSHHFETALDEFADHGIKTGKVTLDLKTMLRRKDRVVDELTKGIEFLLKKNKVDYIVGNGMLKAADTLEVTSIEGKSQVLKTKNIVIATGSDVAQLPGVTIDEKQIVSSTGALALTSVPKSMVVVGAGAIGLELGSVWRRLGAEVTVVEFLDNILPGMDGEVVKQMTRILKKQGMTLRLRAKVTAAKASKTGVTLSIESRDDGKIEEIKADVVLVAIGRKPYSEGLGLDKVGVAMDRDFITTDDELQTNVAGIYAIGDVIGGPMLAHKAEEEGVAVAEHLAGQSGHVNYDVIPGVVYTWPEVASLGKTEEDLKEAGVAYTVGKFPFSANSRARTNADSEGFVKIVADAKTDKVLGVHIVGPAAGDLIAEAVSVMEFGGSAEDIARTCHSHPGLSEAVKEAALAVAGRAIHI
jgi:dihydrolipoamide dehydrogenase